MKNKLRSTCDWIQVSDKLASELDMRAIYDVFSQFSLPPSVILSELTEALNGILGGLSPSIGNLYGKILDAAVNILNLDVSQYDVEIWSNRSHQVGLIVDYHLDNDERVRSKTGKVCTPDYGMILYVGPAGGEVGGTYFNPPLESANDDALLFTRPWFSEVVSAAGIQVPFRPGRLVVFDGRSPHCVAPFPFMTQSRVALLANFWRRAALPRPAEA